MSPPRGRHRRATHPAQRSRKDAVAEIEHAHQALEGYLGGVFVR
jgi:hypothetical protein